MRLERLVAPTGTFLEAFQICDFDLAPMIANYASPLKRMGDNRQAIGMTAQHPSQELLGESQTVAIGQIARAQQPSRQASLERVRGSARHRLDGLREEDLFMPDEHGAERYTALGGYLEHCDLERRRFPFHRNNRGIWRDLSVERGRGSECAVPANHRSLNGLSFWEPNDQRDNSALREIDTLDETAGFDQDSLEFQVERSKIWAETLKIRCG
jgi:hypothetical protein